MTTLPASAVRDTELKEHPRRVDPDGDENAGRQVAVTVTANELIAPNLRRLTLASPDLRALELTGPDEFFGLIMPQPGRRFELLDTGGRNIRAAVADIDEDERPGLRWYTVRHFRQETGEIDVDVVMHDDHPGPGALWVSQVEPGTTAGIWLANAIWIRHAERPLFVADPSAVPALRAVLEFTEDHHPDDLTRYHVVVIAHSPDDLEPGLAEQWQEKLASLAILYAAPGMEAEGVEVHLRARADEGHPSASPEYVWASGEVGMTKTVRGIAVDEWDVDTAFVDWVAYWIEGRPRP
ncbi:MAG: siderophore-interacting protein [Corynebacterium sp.]|uniref:siderophore-interacting protein n=1 Tax=Corynebacterium sp. TaxID=1720 RepID=UPI003F9788F2